MSAVPKAVKTDTERLAQLLKILENRADADYDGEAERYVGNAESSVLAEYTAWLDGYTTDDKGLAVVADAPAMLEALNDLMQNHEFFHLMVNGHLMGAATKAEMTQALVDKALPAFYDKAQPILARIGSVA